MIRLKNKVSFVVLSLFLLVLFLTSAYTVRSFRIRKKAADLIFNFASAKVESRVQQFFDPVERTLQIVKAWGEENELQFDGLSDINARFMPMLKQIPQITSMMVANSQGREYMLLRTGDTWITREVHPKEWGKKSRWNHWKDSKTSTKDWWKTIDYDPRNRPWFNGAEENTTPNSVFWTKPYRFFTTKDPGVTASIKWDHPQNKGVTIVAGFDVLLWNLSDYTMGLNVGENGKVFILDSERLLVGLPFDPKFNRPSIKKDSILADGRETDIAGVSDAIKVFDREGEPLNDPFRFKSAGVPWWGVFRPLGNTSKNYFIGVIVPEAEFSTGILSPRTFALVSLLMGLLLGGIAIGVYFLFLAKPTETKTPTEKLLALIKSGESDNVEFKSTLRWNIKANKTGKEIELAWLKSVVGFLNTDGGTILIGVEDNGNMLGTELDQFLNDDKYLLHVQNLLNQHVGLEFGPNVHYELVPVNGKKALMVRVTPSKAPAFLKHNGEEEFYIRIGPASRKLPTSKVLPYIQDKEKQKK